MEDKVTHRPAVDMDVHGSESSLKVKAWADREADGMGLLMKQVGIDTSKHGNDLGRTARLHVGANLGYAERVRIQWLGTSDLGVPKMG